MYFLEFLLIYATKIMPKLLISFKSKFDRLRLKIYIRIDGFAKYHVYNLSD